MKGKRGDGVPASSAVASAGRGVGGGEPAVRAGVQRDVGVSAAVGHAGPGVERGEVGRGLGQPSGGGVADDGGLCVIAPRLGPRRLASLALVGAGLALATMGILGKTGLTERTLVVLNSDRGDSLLSHGLKAKNQFYEESAAVPLIFRWPGKICSSRTVQTVVSQIDLAPTLLDLAGFPAPMRMLGKPMTRWIDTASELEDDGEADSEAFIEVDHPWYDCIHGQGAQ